MTNLNEISTTGISKVKYTVYNTADIADSLQFSIYYNVSATTGLIGYLKDGDAIKIFPNPTTGKIKFNSEALKIVSLEIRNALGAKVYSYPDFDFTNEIDLSFLPSGVYYLQVSTRSEQKTLKFVKE